MATLEREIPTLSYDKPLAQITLQVSPDEEDYLEIFEGDNLANIVENFCKKWNLGFEVQEMLEMEMMRQLAESGISSTIDDKEQAQISQSKWQKKRVNFIFFF